MPLQPWARSRSGTTICMTHTRRSNSIVTRFLWEQQEPFQSFSRLPESRLPSMRRLSKGCCNRLRKPLRNWKHQQGSARAKSRPKLANSILHNGIHDLTPKHGCSPEDLILISFSLQPPWGSVNSSPAQYTTGFNTSKEC